MRSIKRKGRMLRFDTLVDGTNSDDLLLDRPGIRALNEVGVRSPLAGAWDRKGRREADAEVEGA